MSINCRIVGSLGDGYSFIAVEGRCVDASSVGECSVFLYEPFGTQVAAFHLSYFRKLFRRSDQHSGVRKISMFTGKVTHASSSNDAPP